MGSVHRFLQLPYRDKKLLAHSLFWIVAVRVGLWILPFSLLDQCCAASNL